MGYVWSANEVAEAQKLMLERRFTSEAINVGFETTPEFARAVLPPCFDPLDNRGTITVGTGGGDVCGSYGSALINLNVRYNGHEGQYTLTSIYSDDQAVTVGREFYAEPKKRGSAALYRSGAHIQGVVTRHGVNIIEIDGTLDLTPRDPNVVEVFRYEVNSAFTHDARIAGKPFVFGARKRFVNDVVHAGEATLTLRSNGADPVDEIPIVALTGLTYSTGQMDTIDSFTDVLDDGNDYAPYILGRHFDSFTAYPTPHTLAKAFPLQK